MPGDDDRAASVIRLDDIRVGDELPSASRVVTGADVLAYAEVSGDANPLHRDDAVARAAGFDGVIAHGMFTMGHLAQCLVDWLGDPSPIVRLRVAFRAPVFVGETIIAGGWVRSVDRAGGTSIVDLWTRVRRDGVVEDAIKRGVAELRFPRSPG